MMYFSSQVVDYGWLLNEFVLWGIAPFLSLAIAWGLHKIIEDNIFTIKSARKRILRMIPYQVSGTMTFLIFIVIYRDVSLVWDDTRSGLISGFCIASVSFFVILIGTRFILVKRVRMQDKIGFC